MKTKTQIYNLIKSFTRPERSDEDFGLQKVSFFSYAVIFISAVFCITFCSKSSPIYPFNDWVDVNCFFTVGKSILHGKVLYTDIYEQKGPILYFLHTIFYFMSPNSFLGAYIFEIISSFAFLTISYKTMLLFYSQKIIVAIPFLSAMVYSCPSFSHGGSAEEYCLPFLAFCFYVGIKACFEEKQISKASWLIIGITSAFVLWIKYTLLGIYIGFFLFLLIQSIVKKDTKKFLSCIIPLSSGIILGSLPVIIYFSANGGFTDLFKVYFYDNIFSYSKGASNLFSVIENVTVGYKKILTGILFLVIFPTLTFVFAFFQKKSSLLYCLSTFIFTLFFIYCGGRRSIYYAFPISIFTPIGVALFFHLLLELKNKIFSKTFKTRINLFLPPLYAAFCIMVIFGRSTNVYLLQYEKEELPQFQFAQTISQTENPTMLNYGFLDGGFYTVCDIVPHCKYFCGLNIPLDEIKESQDFIVKNGLSDFVVTRDTTLAEEISEKYEIVCKRYFPFENQIRIYYLYKKIE